ncbi:MAG TPA: hypothetical protein VGA36_03345, partial [Nitriliruptorales bacterium]
MRDVVAFVTGALRFPDRRWWSRRLRCSACGERLTMPSRRTERSVTVTLPHVPVFTVTIELEATRCPGCGLDNVHGQRSGQVADAVVQAL